MKNGKADWFSKTWYNEDKNLVYFLTGRIVLDWINSESASKLLDIGCGYGGFTKILSDKTNLKITAIDMEDEAISKTKEKLSGTDVVVEKQDVLNMSYGDESYDIVLSTGYTSAATLPGAIGEVKRVVKPGGILILDYLRFYNMYYLFSGNLFKRLFRYLSKKDTDQYYFGIFGLRNYLEKEAGLKIEEIKSFYTYPPFLKSNKSKFLFEKTIGRVLKPFLARVLILKLRKVK
jgi:ubiquinone/menaquinone biosynthesis C-methylase UbiE